MAISYKTVSIVCRSSAHAKMLFRKLVLKSFASGIILAVLVVTASLFSNFAPYCGVVLGVALCVLMIQFVRVPSLKISTLLLLGLLVYDVFWVFYSSSVFSANVMVEVAVKKAKNPVSV